MPATIQQEADGIWVLRVSGTLRKSELDAAQSVVSKAFAKSQSAKFLVMVENFQGWEKGGDWGDLAFFVEHGDKIEKIALVADPKWKDNLLVFAGAGFRKGAVEFFPTAQHAQALAWLR